MWGIQFVCKRNKNNSVNDCIDIFVFANSLLLIDDLDKKDNIFVSDYPSINNRYDIQTHIQHTCMHLQTFSFTTKFAAL